MFGDFFRKIKVEYVDFILRDESGWKLETIPNPRFIISELGFPETRLESNNWNGLCSYIKQFVLREE